MQVEDHNSNSGSGSRSHVSQPAAENAILMSLLARIDSFDNYPLPHVVSILHLAKGGFAFTPTAENTLRTTCVGCNKIVDDWNTGDEPFREQFHEHGCQFVVEGSLPSASLGSLSSMNESLLRASVGNSDESTKPLEPGPSKNSLFGQAVLPPSQPIGQNVQKFLSETTQNQRSARYANSLPPEDTRLSFTSIRSINPRGTTDFAHVSARRQPHHSARSLGYRGTPTPSMSSVNISPATVATWSQDQQSSMLSHPEDETQELPIEFPNAEDLQSLIENLDMRNATNRLYTFEQYWSEENEFTNIRLLAVCGFYCIGQGDAVECFCCHVVIANWSRNDNPSQRHGDMSRVCRFIKGQPCGDIPLPLERRRPARTLPVWGHSQPPSMQSQLSIPSHRSRSQHSSPTHSMSSHPSLGGAVGPHHRISRSLSHQGQRSSICNVVSHPSLGGAVSPQHSTPHSSLSPHRSPSHHGQQLSPMQSRSPHLSLEGAVSPSPGNYLNPTLAMVSRSNLMIQFPCLNPADHSMREERARVQTFRNSQFRLNTTLRASDAALAQAGLYYTGYSDRVKCWFCGGGLKDFQPNDDPWIEHAKYFPQCEYLLQQRGPEWINTISTLNPNVVRPAFPRREHRVLPEVESSPTPLPPPPIYTQAQRDVMNRQMLEQAMLSGPATTASGMGYPEEVIRQLQWAKILRDGCSYQTSEALLNALLGTPAPPQPHPQQAHDSPGHHDTPSSTITINGARFAGPSVINGHLFPPSPSHSGSYYSATSNAGPQSGVFINGRSIDEIVSNAFDHPFFHGEMDHLFTGNGDVTVFNNTTVGQPSSVHRFPTAGASNRFPTAAPMRPPAPTVRPPTPPPLRALEIPRLPGRSSSSASTTSSPNTSTTSTSASNTATTQERLSMLERERNCKICLTNEANILFQPCNHICACDGCAIRVTNCPVCRARITRYIRTYHA